MESDEQNEGRWVQITYGERFDNVAEQLVKNDMNRTSL